MVAGVPRRHHFVTKSYLDGFLEQGEKHLYCYGRRRVSCFRSRPDDLANIRDFHSFRRPDGTIDFSLETQIEREVEGPGMPVIRKLGSGKVNLDHDQRKLAAKLIALQGVRVPYERTFIDEHYRQNLEGYLHEMDESSRQLSAPVNAIEVAITPQDDPRLIDHWTLITREEILRNLKELEQDPLKMSRELFFCLAQDIAKVYMNMEWTVYLAPQGIRYITSDRPVVCSSADGHVVGRGIKHLRSVVSFPLSSRALLRMTHHNWLIDAAKKSHRGRPKTYKRTNRKEIFLVNADEHFVSEANQAQLRNSHLWVFTGQQFDWVAEWMKTSPAKGLKHAHAIFDHHQMMRVGNQESRLTRKRQFVVRLE